MPVLCVLNAFSFIQCYNLHNNFTTHKITFTHTPSMFVITHIRVRVPTHTNDASGRKQPRPSFYPVPLSNLLPCRAVRRPTTDDRLRLSCSSLRLFLFLFFPRVFFLIFRVSLPPSLLPRNVRYRLYCLNSLSATRRARVNKGDSDIASPWQPEALLPKSLRRPAARQYRSTRSAMNSVASRRFARFRLDSRAFCYVPTARNSDAVMIRMQGTCFERSNARNEHIAQHVASHVYIYITTSL